MPDPITHCCISYVIARHFIKPHKTLFVLSGMSPDIDVAVGAAYVLIKGPVPETLTEFASKSLICHATAPASLLFLPFFSVAMYMCFRLAKRDLVPPRFKDGYLIVLLGILLHIFMDMMQTGNRPFWPFELTAGFNILPYSKDGRYLTILGAMGILFFDLMLDRFRPGNDRRGNGS